MSDVAEHTRKYEFHERKFFFAMNGLMISFLADMILMSVVMITKGSLDPGILLYVPVAATVFFGVLSVYRETQAKKDHVRDMDYFSWAANKVFGRERK